MDERTGERSQARLGNGNQGEGAVKNQISAPLISLPKGGGAIRGIGEKFAANPVTGTGSITVPIATSPGRSGFGPQLSLSYDSGAGNGPFGFGWSLSLPSITRKTDKGLPKYHDAEESDVFILSGAEDLVPEFKKDASGAIVRDVGGRPVIFEDKRGDYLVRRYRPRIEGLFARIERWRNLSTGEIYWRSISRDNITTFYGKTAESRIADPDESNRVFSWLICESYDDKGNAILYSYKKEEDDKTIDARQAHERNRTTESRKANRYLKRIRYGNTESHVNPVFASRDAWRAATQWLFEIVFDYGEELYREQLPDADGRIFVEAALVPAADSFWPVRQDLFSTYRAGFEVRTYRLCRRVLMFHHFAAELGTADYLARSTEFKYTESPIASFITQITQSGYVWQTIDNKYLKKSLPPLEFKYTEAQIDQTIREIDSESLENLPYGLDGANYQWIDLDGEGLSGILTEQADAWFYKRNISANHTVPDNGGVRTTPCFAPVEIVAVKPTASIASGHAQLMDLAGDGQVDVAELRGFTPGFFERTHDGGWEPFTPFVSLPNIPWADPNLKFIDLTGDGHADVLISEDNVFTWYPSLAEDGFAAVERVAQHFDEEKGPKLVFADIAESIYLADLSGDGLTDLVRIRNGEICYWPNLGYAKFGAKVTMDDAPWFDRPDQFDQKRVRLADIDGSGTTDIIYLGHHQINIYRNHAGNRWSKAESLTSFPRVDNLSAVQAVDLLGNGTACLVWSSPMPGDARRPMRYIALMGEQKPHLLTKTVNNLGAESVVRYAPSTKFYLADKLAGKPWITKLPFPVHVVERVETYDHISRNRFVTSYKYHHGYFDGLEREFRGFGMVEQHDTEKFATLTGDGTLPEATNLDAASHVPPVLTKTWFHTGVFIDRDHISNFFAGLIDAHDRGEYYREPAWHDDDVEARKRLLDDTILPVGLSVEEEREACRALKGSMLRQEIYALDGTAKQGHPYTVTEQNFTIRRLQPRDGNRHAVFFSHAREAINYHYERNPTDPRVSHALTLEVDGFGNVLKSAAIGYGRRQPDPALPLQADRDKQTQTLVTYTENHVTNAIEAADDYRTPMPCETLTYELTRYPATGAAVRFQISDFVKPDPLNDKRLIHVFDNEIQYEEKSTNGKQRRLIEQVRTLYRKNDLTGLLVLGTAESLALPGESYKLAFTLGLLAQVFKRPRDGQPPENLIPNPANVLAGQLTDRGGYVDLDGNGRWWIPSGQVFYAPDVNVANPAATAAPELVEARQHFFLPRKFADPFGQSVIIDYERDLLVVKTKDALDNTVQAENDYRVLQPRLVTDPNQNRVEVVFDALGFVVGTAVMGKTTESLGDSLAGFVTDLTQMQIDDFFNAVDPHTLAENLLKSATTRIIYDIDCFRRSRAANPNDSTKWSPPFATTLARETHAADPVPPGSLKIQISFSYSDGFGREIQKKIQAEPGPVVDGGPVVNPRWVGSGWTIFNNKGKPVRQYEPFFSKLPEKRHRFEFGNKVGVSPILFYDPVERVVATLHPNHTLEKVVFDPWRQETWDVNDTVALDPRNDENVKGFVLNPDSTLRLPAAEYIPTWHALRTDPANLAEANLRWPDPKSRDAEKGAAEKAAIHAKTPTSAHFDSLGRPFLTLAHNGFKPDGTPSQFPTRVELDIEGNQRAVIEALGRTVMRYDYDMLGNRIHQASMEAGERWMLNDVTGKPIRAWDSRGHQFKTEYDQLRRPVRQFVRGTDAKHSDPRTLNRDVLFEKFEYGEGQPNDIAIALNVRTRVFKQYDGAGVVTNIGRNPVTTLNEAYDFKGNLLRTTRELVSDHKNLIDWSVPPPAGENFDSSTSYDALNRPVTLTTPDNSVIRPTYNEANLLNAVEANLRGDAVSTPFISNIDYDAKGQRMLIEFRTRDDSGITTTYDYDDETFRLIHLKTRRNAAGFDGTDRPGEVQNLRYTYDPVGNITHIRDDSQQTVYFRNKRVEPSNEYIYDAIYRLIDATGREHLGKVGGSPIPCSYNDAPRIGIDWAANDGKAMGTYRQNFIYDEVGNFKEMIHRGTDPVKPGWTRAYAYDEPSLLEAAKKSNRLTSTTIGATTETYSTAGDGYDPHGNMLRMPHLQVLQWDFRDRLIMTQRQKVNDEDEDGMKRQGERTYYVYDAGGQRVRKVTELAGGVKDERIYLGGFEIYRRQGTNSLIRETLHIMDDKQRIALVETKTQESGFLSTVRRMFLGPETLIRYQFGNHLGSASLELDDSAEIISYEEYYPYGSTSYQAVRNQTETPKRYRYTGKERDEESGFYYHGARYYAPWLGRWSSCDRLGIIDGPNIYLYTLGNPVRFTDRAGNKTIEEQINEIESPVGWFFAKTGYDIWNVASLGTLSKVESQKNLGTWEGLGESGFAGARSISNTASLGIQDRIYETQMKEGPGLQSIGKGVLKAGEDILPIEEADILANPDATAAEKWRAGAMALSKTANLFAMGASVTGKNVTLPRAKGAGTHPNSLSIERIQAINQQQALKGQLRKTTPPKNIKQRRIYEKAHGKLNNQFQPDHIVEMQLGGPPKAVTNLAPLDATINRSVGPRLQGQIRKHRIGQRYDRALIEGERVPVPDAVGVPLSIQTTSTGALRNRQQDETVNLPDLDMETKIVHSSRP